MTEAEKKALEDECRIKSKEQFIAACRRAAIPDDWYAFTCDRTKPVSIDEGNIYYRKIGVTSFAVPVRRWDAAFGELLAYQKEFAWEQSGAAFRIDRLTWETDAQITGREAFPYVTLRQVGFSREPDRKLLDDGWEYEGYDHYMGYSNYSKAVDIRSLKAVIVVEFTKLTDDRDRETFGFRERSMRGSYRYPIPADLKDVITRCVQRSGDMTEPLRNLLKQRVGKTLLEDEYRALAHLKDEHLQALLSAIDGRLSEEEQKSAFAEASRRAERDNPSVDNIYGSRSHAVEHQNFDLAYEKAGLH